MYSKSISKRSLNIIALSIAVSVFSQNTKNSSVQTENSRKDSTKLTIVKEERNVMLNASDANAPREIPIGLPSTFVNVYENGMPAVYSSVLYNVSANWRNESSLASLGLMDPIESAISTGNVAYSVTSKSHLGTENQRGIINYAINHRDLTSIILVHWEMVGYILQLCIKSLILVLRSGDLPIFMTAHKCTKVLLLKSSITTKDRFLYSTNILNLKKQRIWILRVHLSMLATVL